MASFFSNLEKNALSAEITNIADTFARPIIVCMEAKKVIISSDPNYNRFQANDLNLLSQNPENVPVTYAISGRIMYDTKQPTPLLSPYSASNTNDGQIKIPVPESKVRIKVDASGFALLKDVKMLQFDGIMFELDGIQRPHGLFDSQYWTFFLNRSNK
jgi:hypothetical protein